LSQDGIFTCNPLGATQHQILNAEYDGSGNLLYLGLAAPGTANGSSGWLISKFTYDGSNRVLTKRFAGGNLDYTKVWDNRAALSYS